MCMGFMGDARYFYRLHAYSDNFLKKIQSQLLFSESKAIRDILQEQGFPRYGEWSYLHDSTYVKCCIQWYIVL